VASRFVRARLLRIQGADLNLFEFDYDLTWVAFFMNADEKIYGRYGSRDASGPDARLSVAGFRYAMQTALDSHRMANDKPPPRAAKSFRVDDYPAAKRMGNGCIHCHQVWEFRRDYLKSTGKWSKDEIWVYPLPENIGLTLDVDQGDRIKAVAKDSAADRAGLAVGDLLRTLNGYSVASIGDVQFALHKAPAKGSIPVAWERNGKPQSGTLLLDADWRKTNVTWRPSMLDILPALSLSGDDLSAEEKKKLGLSVRRLAFRQEAKVHKSMQAAGIQGGDIIVGIDGKAPEMTMIEFFGYVRRNYLIGERVTLNIIRNGKRVDLPITLK